MGLGLDADRLLDGIEPAVMDEWLALEEVDPEPLGRVVEILLYGLSRLCNAMGAETEPADLEPERLAREEAMQKARGEEAASVRRPEREASPNQAAALAACALGRPTRR